MMMRPTLPGPAVLIPGAQKITQGGHSVTAFAHVDIDGTRTTIIAKAVRHNQEHPESNQLYRKFLAAELACYEGLFAQPSSSSSAAAGRYVAPFHGTASLHDGDGKALDEVCLCLCPAGISLGRYLMGLSKKTGGRVCSAGPSPSVVYEDSVVLVSEIWDAVRFLHSRGFCHGDIKPSNVVVGTTGPDQRPRARLIDFGKSYSIAAEAGESTKNRINHRPATTAYEAATWSPWSVRDYSKVMRRPPADVDVDVDGGADMLRVRAGALDVFGMALMAIDCLTGTTLESMPVHLRASVKDAYCAWAGVPPDLRAYAAWVRRLPDAWDRTPAHFWWAWSASAAFHGPRTSSAPTSSAEARLVTGSLSRRLARLQRAGPLWLAVLGPMTHPDPMRRPSAAWAHAHLCRLAAQLDPPPQLN